MSVNSPWSRTYSGRKFYPADPNPENVSIVDISHHLAGLTRFTGALRCHFSIAQHSLLVAALVPEEDKLWGLLHDGSEAYLADVPRPAKCSLSDYKAMERMVQKAIATKFDLSWPMPPSVKHADMVALVSEAFHHHPFGIDGWEEVEGVDVLTDHPLLHPMNPKDAELAFVREFNRLDKARMDILV